MWDLHKKRINSDSLLGFLDKFESKECVIDTKTLPYESSMLRPLSLLAKSHEMSGEYHKAISLYIYLAKSVDDEKHKYALMEHLGDTYTKAGLLERARGVYADILSSKPRNIGVLYSLGDVYQMLHNFPKALETTTPLKALGEDTSRFEAFLSFEMLISDRKIPEQQKIEALIALLRENNKLYRQVFSQLLVLDSFKAWEMFDASKASEIIDILWFRDESQIDIKIVENHEILQSIYYAKGYLKTAPASPSGHFAIDMIVSAKQSGNDNGTLNFSYVCDECKHNFVSYFKRCPNCKSVYSVKVEEQIGKKQNKTNHSLL
jgi:tetratricopeptide (TPR) repeat protein